MRLDNFRLVEAGDLPDVIEQVRKWHEGVRGLEPENEAWDELIHNAPDDPHFEGMRGYRPCVCHLCRPRRRYK
jgi:hypothetical protein